jgi:hypothetical protein
MIVSIFICLAAFFWLLWSLRRTQISLGLPIAYLFLLLLLHVPGAFAHVVGSDFLADSEETATGIYLTAIGVVSFVVGVSLSGRSALRPINYMVDRAQYRKFCLLWGWLVVFGLSPLHNVSTLGAAVDWGGGIWMLGVLLGLRTALQRRDFKAMALWGGALSVYPIFMLLIGGFLSYGATAVAIAGSVLAICSSKYWRVVIGILVITFVGVSLFVNYFQHRDEIRAAVWGGASMAERVDAVLSIARDFEWFGSANEAQLQAIDLRLNENNYFVGLATERIDQGQVDYLYGRSLWDGVLALVPRALWPEKPVFAGGMDIDREMTGLDLSENSSWGVGQVMEFHINFGIPGVVVGFLAFGWLLGLLDRKAAEAERTGNLGRLFLFFLPGAALVQPEHSMVELTGAAGAALAAGYGWEWTWNRWPRKKVLPPKITTGHYLPPSAIAGEAGVRRTIRR